MEWQKEENASYVEKERERESFERQAYAFAVVTPSGPPFSWMWGEQERGVRNTFLWSFGRRCRRRGQDAIGDALLAVVVLVVVGVVVVVVVVAVAVAPFKVGLR